MIYNVYCKLFYGKSLAKMMNCSDGEKQNIRIANYFDDLKIIAAFHRRFPCSIIHRRTACRKGCFSLEMILNGEVYLYLDDRKIHLKSPCLFWIGENTGSFQFELIPGVGYDHHWIDFTGERGRRIYKSLCDAFPESWVQIRSEKVFQSIFDRFSHQFQLARRPASSPENVMKVEQIMYELANECSAAEFDSNDPYGIKKIAEYIAGTPFQKYDLPGLAAQAGLSYVHFRALFKKLTGMSVKQYILEQQMLTAGELLKSRQFRIGELADYCGFDDIASFTRTFKRYYRISPMQWLEKISPDQNEV